mmetsp:Transcript_62254/g.145992  ORF Transcript_62254/g.145992 Transcript_62254/m.145992 type:complete len:201 (+) Transcript_62254:104-706(+)
MPLGARVYPACLSSKNWRCFLRCSSTVEIRGARWTDFVTRMFCVRGSYCGKKGRVSESQNSEILFFASCKLSAQKRTGWYVVIGYSCLAAMRGSSGKMVGCVIPLMLPISRHSCDGSASQAHSISPNELSRPAPKALHSLPSRKSPNSTVNQYTDARRVTSSSEAASDAKPISCEKSAKAGLAKSGTWPRSSWHTSGSGV